jgi:hypothetical protein
VLIPHLDTQIVSRSLPAHLFQCIPSYQHQKTENKQKVSGNHFGTTTKKKTHHEHGKLPPI